MYYLFDHDPTLLYAPKDAIYLFEDMEKVSLSIEYDRYRQFVQLHEDNGNDYVFFRHPMMNIVIRGLALSKMIKLDFFE